MLSHGGVRTRPYRRFVVHHAGDFSVVKKRDAKKALGDKGSERCFRRHFLQTKSHLRNGAVPRRFERR
jgi:hypothetical protein